MVCRQPHSQKAELVSPHLCRVYKTPWLGMPFTTSSQKMERALLLQP